MARLPRFSLPGHPQHVIVRGNNRDSIFHEEEDYRYYLKRLRQACDRHKCDVHAYVLMTNHVHLLVTPLEEHSLSSAIQMIGRYYVQYFNRSYQRTGTLWEGRYKATLIDSEAYALGCYRYIELNPVRVGMVRHPRDYPWSSYRFNALGEPDMLVVPQAMYRALGRDFGQRRKAYRALFKSRIPEKMLTEIRDATNKAWVLGGDSFKDRIAANLGRAASPRPRGGDRRSSVFHATQRNDRV